MVSVGNLAVGGRNKTPVVAAIARMLHGWGERPAVLSRGYRRESPSRDVVIVRDAEHMRASLAESGDEPFMLARELPGCCVLVDPLRARAGQMAEQDLQCTVHVLDDGFQHVQLARDANLVLLTLDDVLHGEVLPAGRLREPLHCARTCRRAACRRHHRRAAADGARAVRPTCRSSKRDVTTARRARCRARWISHGCTTNRSCW